MGQEPKKTWFDQAVLDPSKVYKSPAEVLADGRLDGEGMRKVLEAWEQDAKRLIQSSEEGMAKQEGPDEGARLKAVQAALAELDKRDEVLRDKSPSPKT
jgi:hypothetical protein